MTCCFKHGFYHKMEKSLLKDLPSSAWKYAGKTHSLLITVDAPPFRVGSTHGCGINHTVIDGYTIQGSLVPPLFIELQHLPLIESWRQIHMIQTQSKQWFLSVKDPSMPPWGCTEFNMNSGRKRIVEKNEACKSELMHNLKMILANQFHHFFLNVWLRRFL